MKLNLTISAAIASMLVIFLLANSVSEISAITCNDVIKDLRPCLNYLKSGSGAPPTACCAGASSLNAAAKTTAEKRTACGCIKSATKNIKMNSQLAQSLPSNCGISLPYTISPNFDCSTVN